MQVEIYTSAFLLSMGETIPFLTNQSHVRRFYGINDIFGGNGAILDHSAILKTIKINDSVLQALITHQK